MVDNQTGGFVSAPTTINLSGGVLRNAGTLDVGGTGGIGTTVLTGDLESPDGTVRIDNDPASQQSDLLQVSGHADLGVVAVSPKSFRRVTTDPVITAAAGITSAPIFQDDSAIFSYTPILTATTLAIALDADFSASDSTKSASQRNLAAYLQRLFDNGTPGFDDGFFNLPVSATTAIIGKRSMRPPARKLPRSPRAATRPARTSSAGPSAARIFLSQLYAAPAYGPAPPA